MELPKSTLFDEKAADDAVNRSLHNEIRRLREELKMSRIIKSTEGKYYKGDFEEVPASDVTALIALRQQQLAELEAIAPAQPSAPAAGTDTIQTPPANPAPGTSTPADGTQTNAAPANPVIGSQDPNVGQAAPTQPQAPTLQ